MGRAGISGMGVLSALGGNCRETAEKLWADNFVLPSFTRRFDTALKLPVFELDEPEKKPEFKGGYPLLFLLHALEEALLDAGLTREALKSYRVGIAVGTTVACQLDSIEFYSGLRAGESRDPEALGNYVNGLPAEYLRRTLGVTGPAITVSNACSSGADACMIALDWLKSGVCDIAIACGTDSVGKVSFDGFNSLRVCSPEPCRPFDGKRQGLNLGDAAAVIILEDPATAAARGVQVEYLLSGAGKTADAFHITQPEPEGVMLEKAIRDAMDEAGLSKSDVEYINAHGTGTRANDKVESLVFKRIFDEVKFSSTKCCTGHTLGAAGALELALTVLMLKEKRCFANLRLENPDEEIPLTPVTQCEALAGRAALSTSLAFGGSNTVLAVKKFDGKNLDSTLQQSDLGIEKYSFKTSEAAGRDSVLAICRKYGVRRIDRLTQLALIAADEAAGNMDHSETALITVSACGPAKTTCTVLDDILDYPEEEILPTGFSHSVVNASASYIGTALKINGPTFATVGFEDPFHEALVLAKSLLSSGRCRKVLIVCADEISPISEAVENARRSGFPQEKEGAFALLLSAGASGQQLGVSDEVLCDTRVLPCGVPQSFLAALENNSPQVVVRRLLAPEFAG